jgi:hypothetical protein
MKWTIILLTTLFTACATKPTESASVGEADSTTQETPGQPETSDAAENFEDFFERFKNDSLFQVSRVKFPWTLTTWEPGTDAPSKELVNKKGWKHIDFHYEDTYATRQIEAYTQQVKSYGDTVKLEMRGVDNGILTDYEFTQDNNKWFLVSAKDYSN